MKILYVTTLGITMGFFSEHIKMLLAQGHTVELACNDTVSPVPEIYRSLGLTVHRIPFSRSPLSADTLTAFRCFRHLIKTEQYDLVHTHTPVASAIVRFACRKLRRNGLLVFYTAHGFHFYRGAPIQNWLLYFPVEALCARWTDTLITVNAEDEARARRMLRSKRIRCIPGVGVPTKDFSQEKPDRRLLRNQLNIPPDAVLLTYISELNQNKNQASLLEMMALVCRTRKDVWLLLVGAGPSAEDLRSRAEALHIADRVILAGYRRDIPQILAASDLYVASSIREGLPLNVIEAMAAGIPVVAYDNRGHRSLIEDGVTGELVPNSNPRELARRILSLLEDPRKMARYSQAAQAAAKQYDTQCAVAQMRQIYADSQVSKEGI